ncbi:hypothetical protein [Compostimonas suwonensis]|uniref:Uncharacterized protein n=1 Tax=Compostimonas suwonensis TaxID=1048394 RepID=A0A2M9BZM2_9MICO|nr:hypothetical protein [Compostimonas suwonensis]PJJ63551.1 hypothetical protein CLV54_1221 [Compostimonas suwonensis]
MGFWDRLLGNSTNDERMPQATADPRTPPVRATAAPAAPQRSDDEIAVERYRYLLRTAPPETIEKTHEEAFAKLTPEQRALVFQQLSENAPEGERPRGDDPASLAQAATRSELRQPGSLERSLSGPGNRGGMPGFGSMVMGSLLGTVAGVVIGSAIAQAFLPPVDAGTDQASGDGGDSGDSSGDGGSDAGADAGGDAGWGDSSGDFASGADGGGFGGDFGGGDFGGGDFGF